MNTSGEGEGVMNCETRIDVYTVDNVYKILEKGCLPTPVF